MGLLVRCSSEAYSGRSSLLVNRQGIISRQLDRQDVYILLRSINPKVFALTHGLPHSHRAADIDDGVSRRPSGIQAYHCEEPYGSFPGLIGRVSLSA